MNSVLLGKRRGREEEGADMDRYGCTFPNVGLVTVCCTWLGVVGLSSSHLGTSLGAGGWGSVSENFKPFWNVTASSSAFS